jgi:amidase
MHNVGPIARSAADAAAILGAIAGSDPDDPTDSLDPVPDYLAGIDDGVRGLRIAIDRVLIGAGASRATSPIAAGTPAPNIGTWRLCSSRPASG